MSHCKELPPQERAQKAQAETGTAKEILKRKEHVKRNSVVLSVVLSVVSDLVYGGQDWAC